MSKTGDKTSRRFRTYLVLSLSLPALLIVTMFWIRSYSMGDSLQYYSDPKGFTMNSIGGLCSLSWGEVHSVLYPPHYGWEGSFWPFEREENYTISSDLSKLCKHYWLGFGFDRWKRETADSSVDSRGFVIPHWFLFLLALAPILVTVRTILKDRRVRGLLLAGRCTECGYDLRASPDCCPECGHKTLKP